MTSGQSEFGRRAVLGGVAAAGAAAYLPRARAADALKQVPRNRTYIVASSNDGPVFTNFQNANYYSTAVDLRNGIMYAYEPLFLYNFFRDELIPWMAESYTYNDDFTAVTIVGLAKDIQFNVQPTLFLSFSTYKDLVRTTNPDARGVLPNLVGVEPAPGVDASALAASITQQVGGVEALDLPTAVASLPGVSSIEQSFNIILGLAFGVVILLTGFFFLIITVQKTPSLTLLRAVGASGGFLLRNLVLQVIVVILAALAIAVPLTVIAVSASASETFTAKVDPRVLLVSSAAVLILGVAAAVGAMRRVVRIDPAAATARLAGGGLA